MQCLSFGVANGEAENERSICITKWNRRDDDNVPWGEWLWHVIAEGILRIRSLDERIWRWECLAVIDLVNVLHVLVDRNATDVLEWQSEPERTIRCSVQGDVETIVTDQNVQLERVSCKLVTTINFD